MNVCVGVYRWRGVLIIDEWHFNSFEWKKICGASILSVVTDQIRVNCALNVGILLLFLDCCECWVIFPLRCTRVQLSTASQHIININNK